MYANIGIPSFVFQLIMLSKCPAHYLPIQLLVFV